MTIQINGTSGISGVDGSAATPALQGSDSNTGISFGTDEVIVNAGGATRAKVDGTGVRLEQTLNTTQRIYALRGTGAYALGTSGGAAIGFQSQSNQDDEITFETHDQGTSHRVNMRVGAEGYVEKPNQPGCAVSLDIGWWNPNANASFGPIKSNGGFHWNNGGFYAGSTIGGYPYRLLHVPKSGIYMFCMGTYSLYSTETRAALYRNNTEQVVFREHTSHGTSDSSDMVIAIQYMDADDYINWRYEGGAVNSSFHHANKHTYVQAYFLG
jgi:hypothetical protein